MEIFGQVLWPFLISFGLALLALLLWFIFWRFFSKERTTPYRFLWKAFFSGTMGAVIAFVFEKMVASRLLGVFPSFFQADKIIISDIRGFLFIFGAVFFWVALPEELIKFLLLKISLFRSRDFDQIVDGIKFGLILGLGFSFVENGYFFYKELAAVFPGRDFFLFFFFRFSLTTLVHSLYGGIMGYYFGLARFYRIFKNIFLWQGFISVVILHSFFNLLLLTPFNLLTSLLLVSVLIIVLKWYTDRRNFQLAFGRGAACQKEIKLPFFSERKEIQALIAEGTDSNFHLVEEMGFCPFCFRKIGEKGVCRYCGKKTNAAEEKGESVKGEREKEKEKG